MDWKARIDADILVIASHLKENELPHLNHIRVADEAAIDMLTEPSPGGDMAAAS